MNKSVNLRSVLENTSFLVKGEKCEHPNTCFNRYQKIRHSFEIRRGILEQELNQFRDADHWKTKVNPSRHAKQRMIDRPISTTQLYELIEMGEPIACEVDSYSRA